MKIPPKIPENVAKHIVDWVDNPKKISTNDIRDISEFYSSLNLKHSQSTVYYRGLQISDPGVVYFLNNGNLKLVNKIAESWACKFSVARKFLPMGIGLSKFDEGGIILAKKIPANKVLFDMKAMLELYTPFVKRGTGNVYDIAGSTGAKALRSMNKFGECELVTRTVCTKCDIGDMIHIEFQYYNFDRRSYAGLLDTFLDRFKWDSKSQKLVKYIYDIISNRSIVRINRSDIGSTWNLTIKSPWWD